MSTTCLHDLLCAAGFLALLRDSLWQVLWCDSEKSSPSAAAAFLCRCVTAQCTQSRTCLNCDSGEPAECHSWLLQSSCTASYVNKCVAEFEI